MINVLVSGHGYNHDLFELIRTFYPLKEIVFIDKLEDGSEFNIISILNETTNGAVAITQVTDNCVIISETKVDIGSVLIQGYTYAQIVKLSIKKSVYEALNLLSDTIIPWGILTGIRPMKIVHNLLDLGHSSHSTMDILTNDYRINSEKASFALDITRVQRKHLYPIDENRYSIYISIPFCPTRCSYCSFPSLPIGQYETSVEEYISSLIYEIREVSKIMKGRKLNTVYIGGGTPTSISTVHLNNIINSIYKYFGEDICEFTVEAGRPDTINREILSMLKDNNIDRISINPQTMVDKTLKSIGRNHSPLDVINSFNLAREIGFSVINMDLILGLPGEGDEDTKHTLDEIRKLDPENLTIHSLALKRGSKFTEDVMNFSHSNQSVLDNMVSQTKRFVDEMGLSPYYLYRQKQISGNLENIGYSKMDMECIYNISMMEEKETIIGLGMGAVSKIYTPKNNKIIRVPNFKSLNEYINRLDELIKKKGEVLF